MAMKRFRVAETSMVPTLLPGDEFVGTSSVRPGVGDVVAVLHPERDDFWLVKRVTRIAGEDALWIESDNAGANAVDSRTLGPVAAEGAMTMVTRVDAAGFVEAVEMLSAEDDALARVVEEHGVPDFWQRPAGLATLVLLILEQQVSLESGAAVYARLLDLLGEVTGSSILAAGEARLHGIGLTRQKAGYVIGLAAMVVDGSLDLDGLGDLPMGEARERLLSIRGVGPWTADAYLLSALGHLDVFPVGDRALQVGAGEVLGMATAPSPDELEVLSQPWRPVRAVAARLIWHSYLVRRGRSEPAHASGAGA